MKTSTVKSLTTSMCTAIVKQTNKTVYPLVDFALQPMLNLIKIGLAQSTPHVKKDHSSVILCLGGLPIS